MNQKNRISKSRTRNYPQGQRAVRRKAYLVLIVAVALLLAMTMRQMGVSAETATTTEAHSPTATGTITGTAFRDISANGALDTGEPGVAGIMVTAYDASNTAQGSAVTGSDGTYTLNATGTGPYRLEFTSLPSYLQPSVQGTNNNTTVQFVPDGDSSNVDVAVYNSAEYCQNNPALLTGCYVIGDQSGTYSGLDTIAGVFYDDRFYTENGGADTGLYPNNPRGVAIASEVGTTFGLAWNRDTNTLYAGAHFKVLTGFGPDGPGAIYEIDILTEEMTGTIEQGTGGVNLLIDLKTDASATGITVCDDPHGSDIDTLTIEDSQFTEVGKCSLGDIEISEDNNYLYAVNLTDRKVVEIDLTTDQVSDHWDVPTDQTANAIGTCSDSVADIRPFGLGVRDGLVYVGMVCTEESNATFNDYFANLDPTGASNPPTPVWAYVYAFDPTTATGPADFNLVLDFNLRATRQSWAKWRSTINEWTNANVNKQPIISDIAFYGDDMTLGIRDRAGDQWGFALPNNTPDGYTIKGDLLCAAGQADGTYVIESGDHPTRTCGDRTGLWQDDTNFAWPFQGFYYGDGGKDGTVASGAGDPRNNDGHDENSLGGIAQVGLQDLVITSLNPGTANGVNGTNQGGYAWLDNTNGTPAGWHRFYVGNTDDGYLGKANGLGDMEALCAPAPIEVGNYIWDDANGNGIQDPGESGLDGVPVTLTCGADSISVNTANGGQYYFSNDPNGGNATFMDAGESCTLSVPATHSGMSITTGSAATNDLHDNDADSNGDIPFTAGGAGENNHTFDIGYVASTATTCNITIGDTGNPADGASYSTMVNGAPVVHNDPNQIGRGSVAYSYDISSQPITVGDWVAYLNSEDPDGDDDRNLAGAGANGVRYIAFSGMWEARSLSSMNGGGTLDASVASLPITNISLNQAAHYLNWLATGNIDTGAYTFVTANDGSSDIASFDSSFAGPRLPFLDEYYKAMFWDQANTNYNLYPTTNVDVNGIPVVTTIDAQGIHTTPAGAFYNFPTNNYWAQVGQGTPSPYGLYDGTGNRHDLMLTSPDALTIVAKVGRWQDPEARQRSSWVEGFASDEATPYLSVTFRATCGPVLEDELGAIGNYVWVDENADGYQDAGERGIPGVIVTLEFPDGSTITTTTDANGGYLFDNLPSGTYTVTVDTNQPALTGMGHTGVNLPGADFGNQDPTGYPVTIGGNEPLENLTADFGFIWGKPNSNQGSGAIGDAIWLDADGDGVQDPDEIGIEGVCVELLTPGPDNLFGTSDDVVAATTTTDSTGFYIFDLLNAGAYQVRVCDSNFDPGGPLENFSQTGDPDHFGGPGSNNDNITTAPIVLAPGDVFLNADFGYQPPAGEYDNAIGDTIWFDANADGVEDAGEYGIPGVTVVLLDSNGNVVATTTTDENGMYLFDNLPDGTYTVWVNDTDNVLGDLVQSGDPDATFDNMSTTTVSGGQTDLDQDFGYTPEGHSNGDGLIGDTIWFDIDGSGDDQSNQGDEPGIEGVVVTLTYPDGSVVTTTTDENGNYWFGGLDPSETYTVTISPVNFLPGGVLEGMSETYDPDGGTAGQSVVDLSASGGTNLDQDFSYTGTTGQLGNLVWLDDNADGDDDNATNPDEAPIAGVTIDLYRDLDCNGQLDAGEPFFGSTTTVGTVDATEYGSNGVYDFDNLPVVGAGASGGACFLVDVSDDAGVLLGYWHSLGTTGADNNSQTDPYGGIELTAGAPTDLTADFGYYVDPAKLGNFVWNDLDGDGVQDAGEPGIDGITMTLTITYPDGTNVTLATVTGDDPSTPATEMGWYGFCNLLLDEDYNSGSGSSVPSATEPAFSISATFPAGYVSTIIDAGAANDQTDADDPAGVVADPTQGQDDIDQDSDPSAEGDPEASYDFGVTDHLALGNLVFADTGAGGNENNGQLDNDESGIDNVTVMLYLDDGDMSFDSDDTLIDTQITAGGGLYLFTDLSPGCYFVHIPAAEFQAGGDLYDGGSSMAWQSSSGGGSDDATDHDADENGVDDAMAGTSGITSNKVCLTPDSEPTSATDGEFQDNHPSGYDDADVNLTVDLGFYLPTQTAVTVNSVSTTTSLNVVLALMAMILVGLSWVVMRKDA